MESTQELPEVFIGSSSEGLDIAYAVQEELEHDANATVWSQGMFQLSSTILDDLLRTLDTTDFGIFVFSADDVLKIRDQHVLSVRDNVIFELGLFIGRLSKERSYFIIPNHDNRLHLPTDLLGITPATFNAARKDIRAAIGPACNKIRKSIRELGKFRKSYNSTAIPKQGTEIVTVTQKSKTTKKIASAQQHNVARLQRGQRTPQEAYCQPILKALVELGGSAAISDVLKKVEKSMKEILKPVDYETLSSGHDIRWRNAAQFARNTMVGKGLLKSNSPWGIWEITEAGRKTLTNEDQ